MIAAPGCRRRMISAARSRDTGCAAEEDDAIPGVGRPLGDRREQIDAGRALADGAPEQPRRPDDDHPVGDRQVGPLEDPPQLAVLERVDDEVGVHRRDLMDASRRSARLDHRGDPVDRLVERDVVDGHAHHDRRTVQVHVGGPGPSRPDPVDLSLVEEHPQPQRRLPADHLGSVEERTVRRSRHSAEDDARQHVHHERTGEDERAERQPVPSHQGHADVGGGDGADGRDEDGQGRHEVVEPRRRWRRCGHVRSVTARRSSLGT